MNKKTLLLFNSDPELKKIAEEYLEKEQAGLLKVPLKSNCMRLKDLCLLIFKKVQINGEYQMLEENNIIKTWVWFGNDFRDKIVGVVEEVAPQLSDCAKLEELRLVATSVSITGIQRLRLVFPNAKVLVYSDGDHHVNWQLSQAAYKVGKESLL